MKYKVGDVVLVRAKIVEVDKADREFPYRDESGFWFREKAVVADNTGTESEVTAVPRFEVGDKVIHKHKPEWGVGEVLIIKTDYDCASDFCGKEMPEDREGGVGYLVKYAHKAEHAAEIPDTGSPFTIYRTDNGWFTFESNLVAA